MRRKVRLFPRTGIREGLESRDRKVGGEGQRPIPNRGVSKEMKGKKKVLSGTFSSPR